MIAALLKGHSFRAPWRASTDEMSLFEYIISNGYVFSCSPYNIHKNTHILSGFTSVIVLRVTYAAGGKCLVLGSNLGSKSYMFTVASLAILFYDYLLTLGR